MKKIGGIGITAVLLLVIFLLVSTASSTILLNGTDDLSLDAEQTVKDAIDEITRYLKIEDAIGKYYTTNGVKRVEKIVILVKQFIQSTINMHEVKIKICNNNDVILLDYSGFAVKSNSKGTFENQVWDLTNNTFSLIVLFDKDKSLLDYDTMNKDTAFIAIKLSDQFTMRNSDSITVSVIPSNGMTSSIVLETPSVHLSNIISFRES